LLSFFGYALGKYRFLFHCDFCDFNFNVFFQLKKKATKKYLHLSARYGKIGFDVQIVMR